MNYTLYEHLNCPLVGPERMPQFIAIHWYGEPGKSSDVHGTARYLSSIRTASVHYVTQAGIVYCLVSPNNVAYAQGDGGNGYGNTYGISIENNPRCSPEDRETTAQLIAQIRIDFGVNFPLRPHKHFTSTSCPGVWEQWIPWLDRRASEIVAQRKGTPAPTPAPAPKPAPAPAPAPVAPGNGKVPYCIVEAGDTGYAVARQFGISFDRLAGLNPGVNWNALKVGQRLYLVNHCFVEAGDTGYGIARQFNVSFDQLAAWNPGTNWNALKVGQALWLE